MKVQLLYLDPHDDHVSVRDKMGWVKADRLLVIWPRYGRVLTRRLDLVLLRRQADRLGTRLGLVTFDPDVRDHAAVLGIPVFDSPDGKPESLWADSTPATPPVDISRRRDPPEPPRAPARAPASKLKRGLDKGVRWAAGVLAVASILALLAVLVPSAQITLTPRIQTQQKILHLTLDTSLDSPTASGEIPAVRHQVAVNGQLRRPTTGRVQVPESTASGEVTFTNLGQEPITVPAGIGVTTSLPHAPRFVTTEDAVLKGGSGAQATATVKAAAPGSDGNVPAGAIEAIEGSLGLQVRVTNAAATSGGSDSWRPAVAASDLTALKQALLASLQDQAGQAIQAQLDPGQIWDPASLQVDQEQDIHFDAQPGDVADGVSLSMTVAASALVISQSDVTTVARLALAGKVQPGWKIVPGSLTVSRPLAVEGASPLEMTAVAGQSVYRSLNTEAIRRQVVTLTPAEARQALNASLPLSALQIETQPGWLPRLPWLASRIDVRTSWGGS